MRPKGWAAFGQKQTLIVIVMLGVTSGSILSTCSADIDCNKLSFCDKVIDQLLIEAGVLTRTKLKTEDRQAELVQAALVLAAQKSPAEITTGDLAQAVGITQGGVFKHFESKEAIWLAVLDWAHQALIGRLQRLAVEQESSAMLTLRAVFMAHIGFVQEFPGVPRLIFQELQHAKPTPLKGRVQKLMADYRNLLSGVMAQLHEEGQMRPDVDLKAAVVLFMGAVQGLVMQSLVTGSLKDMSNQAKTVFNIYEAGLLVQPRTEARKRK